MDSKKRRCLRRWGRLGRMWVRFSQGKRAALGPVEERRADLESVVLWKQRRLAVHASVPGEMVMGAAACSGQGLLVHSAQP